MFSTEVGIWNIKGIWKRPLCCGYTK